MTDDVCKRHSGLDHEIDNLKHSDTKQWDCLDEMAKQKASNSFVRWVIGIGLIIGMAIVGFLWNNQAGNMKDVREGQAAILTEIKTYKTEEINERKNMGEQMLLLRDSVKDLERDVKTHMRETRGERDSHRNERTNK